MMLCGGTKGQGSCHPLPRGPPLGPAPAGHPAPAANLGDRSLKPRLICTCCRLDLTPWLGWAPPGHAWIPGPLMLTRHAPTSSDLPEAPRTEALGGLRGPQHSAGTGGGGEARERGRGGPLRRVGCPAGFAVVTVPGSPVPAVRQHLPTQCGRSCRGCPRRGSASRGQGSFSPPCSLFPSSATQKEKKRGEKKQEIAQR